MVESMRDQPKRAPGARRWRTGKDRTLGAIRPGPLALSIFVDGGLFRAGDRPNYLQDEQQKYTSADATDEAKSGHATRGVFAHPRTTWLVTISDSAQSRSTAAGAKPISVTPIGADLRRAGCLGQAKLFITPLVGDRGGAGGGKEIPTPRRAPMC